MSQYPFHVQTSEAGGHTRHVTVTIDVNDEQPAQKVLGYLRSIQLKNDFMNSWVAENASGYGLEIRNGPRPVFEDPNDRTSPVVAYAQDFRLTRSV